MNWGDIFRGKDGGNPEKSIAKGPCTSFFLRNLPFSSIPAAQQILSVTKDAGAALAGVGRNAGVALAGFGKHVNSSLQNLGVSNISKGVGGRVGIFGAGLIPKSGIVRRVQSYFGEAMLKMMVKHGLIRPIRESLQSGVRMIASTTDVNVQSTVGSVTKSLEAAKNTALDLISSGNSPTESIHESMALKETLEGVTASRIKKVVSDSLQNSASEEKEGKEGEKLVEQLQPESNAPQMLSKYEESIEKLTKENEMLSKLLEANENKMKTCPHGCFECRRRERKARGRASSWREDAQTFQVPTLKTKP